MWPCAIAPRFCCAFSKMRLIMVMLTQFIHLLMYLLNWILAHLQVFVAVAGGDWLHCLLEPGSPWRVPAVGWMGVGVHLQKVFWPFCRKTQPQIVIVYRFYFYSVAYSVLYCIYHTQHWNIQTCYHGMFHKTATFDQNGALATLQYSTCATVL